VVLSEDELFASRHQDEISVACVEERCNVQTYSQFCRYVVFILFFFQFFLSYLSSLFLSLFFYFIIFSLFALSIQNEKYLVNKGKLKPIDRRVA